MPPGGTLAVLGRNGVGKTTLLTTLMGITTRHSGTIHLGDLPVGRLPLPARASVSCAAGTRDFSVVDVEENLAVSVLPGGWNTDKVYELFPRLKERRRNTGNRLSGGEQQMLAVARALVGAPKVLLLDEPLEGLAPVIVDALLAGLNRLKR